MAKTPPKIVNGKERKQITAFIVDVDSPGLEITYRCHFMGLRALYNGIVKFTNVRVPRENMIAKEGAGLESCPNDFEHRPPDDSGGVRRFVETAARDLPQMGQRTRAMGRARSGSITRSPGKIAEMAGNVFAMEAITFLTSALVDRKAGDLRIETAMCKMWATETTWRIADEAMQVRGGRGYETAQSLAGRGEEPIAVERFLRDCRINMIFEGSSEIMRLFIAREALDPHLKVGGAIFNTQLPMSERDQGDVQLRKILRDAGIRNSGFGGDAGRSRQVCTPICARMCDYARAHEQETRARSLPRHDAVRSEARSRATAALALLSGSRRSFSR